MKLSGLFQPRTPVVWLAVVLNTLSATLAWIVHNRMLDSWVTLLIGGFALGNALIGSWLVWRLLRSHPSI